MVSSGVTAVATTTDAAVDVISEANTRLQAVSNARVVNTSAVAGYFSLDGGISWHYLPATATGNQPAEVQMLCVNGIVGVQLKRIASGSNVTGVYASLW